MRDVTRKMNGRARSCCCMALCHCSILKFDCQPQLEDASQRFGGQRAVFHIWFHISPYSTHNNALLNGQTLNILCLCPKSKFCTSPEGRSSLLQPIPAHFLVLIGAKDRLDCIILLSGTREGVEFLLIAYSYQQRRRARKLWCSA